MKKNRFLIFLCSIIPGVAHMYLNMMRKGLVIMSVFALTILFATEVYIPNILVVLPVIWLYSFFDAFHMNEYILEERIQKDYVIFEKLKKVDFFKFFKKYPFLKGIIFVFVGVWILTNMFFVPFLESMHLWNIVYIIRELPMILVSIGMIFFGIYSIRCTKKQNS